MNLHVLRDGPSPSLATALAEFDMRFSYPLGAGRSFRISHGEDYPRFFRAMGDARCFVAEQDGRVIGALGIAIRTVTMPDGSVRKTAYIGDLKVDATARGSFVLLRLAQAADAWARPQVSAAYGVVMDGTGALPPQYTGRIGIEAFAAIGTICVLRFPTAPESGEHLRIASQPVGEACFNAISHGRYSASGGNPAERSQMEPFWLVHRDGLACGRLEDTRRAKRLIADDGNEMHSAHLACFAWRTSEAALELVQSARSHAASLGFPALFVAVSLRDMEVLDAPLGAIDKVIAPATIYGAGLTAGADWIINSSEI